MNTESYSDASGREDERLRRIRALLDQSEARDRPTGEILRAIADVAGEAPADIYQKPLG